MTRKELARTAIIGVVLAAATLRPALTDINGNLPGVIDTEHGCGAWLYYRSQELILDHGEIPLVFHDTSFREGGRCYPLCLLNMLLTLPLNKVLEAPGVQSVSLALNVALAFIFGMMLLQRLGGCWWGALPGALLFSLAPYMFSHLIYGPTESTTYAWLALSVLAAEALAVSPKLRLGLAALAGLTVALCFANSPYNGVFAAALVAFSLATRRVTLGPLWRRGVHLGAVLAAAGVLIAPMAWAIRHTLDHPLSMVPGREARHAEGMHNHMVDATTVQDVANFLLPIRAFHNETYQEDMYLGFVALVVAVIAMVRVRRARRWGWLALGAAVFCLGGTLQVFGWTPELLGGPLRMPAGLLCRLPVLDSISHPYRFEPVVLMGMGAAIAILLGRGDGAVAPKPRRWQALLLSGAIVLDMGLSYPEGPFRLPVVEVDVPQFYKDLGELEGDYAVLDAPVAATTRSICTYYLYQLHHDKFVPYNFRELDLGQAPHAVDFADAMILSSEFEFRAPRNSGPFTCTLHSCVGMKEFVDRGYRYLVLHRVGTREVDRAMQECVQRCIPAPVYQDDQVTVYEFGDGL